MRLPGAIVANAGQWRPSILYADMLGRYAFTRDGVLYKRADALMRIDDTPGAERAGTARMLPGMVRFLNASANMRVIPYSAPDAGVGNAYAGPDSAAWMHGMALRAGVTYRNVWDSVDAEFRDDMGRLAITLRLRPGAKPRDVRLETNNSDRMRFNTLSGITTPAFAEAQSNNDGNIILTISGYGDTLAHATEFSTYIGGNESESVSCISVRDDGSTFLTGYTTSQDWLGDNVWEGIYVMHLACDGRRILYNSMYAPSPGKQLTWDGAPVQSRLCIKSNGFAIAAGWVGSLIIPYIPITSNALEKPGSERNSSALFFELDESGGLRYASLFGYLENHGHGSAINAMALDSQGNLVLTGWFTDGFKYFTPGTVDPTPTRWGRYVATLPPSLDAVIRATRVGTHYEGVHSNISLALDHQDNIIVLGPNNGNPDTMITVNAFDSTYRPLGMFIQKLTPDMRAFVFSTYLGGSGREWTHQGHPFIGPDNTIHIVGTTSSLDFPIVGSSRGHVGDYDGFYLTLSPEGRILRSLCLGGTLADDLIGVNLDRDGNAYLYGSSISPDFPIRNSLGPAFVTKASQTTLSVLKSGSDTLLLSTRWNIDDERMIFAFAQNTDRIQLRPSGYLSLAGSVAHELPTFNAMRDHPFCTDSAIALPVPNCGDGFLTRIFLPFAGQDFLRTTVTGTDSLQLETSHNIIHGGRFMVAVRVSNPSARDTAYNADVIIKLPSGVSLDPPSQSLTRTLHSPFLPGDTASFTWTVRVDSIRDVDSVFAIRAVTEYDLESAPLSCERPFVRGAHYVPIYRYVYPSPVFSCTVEAPDSLALAVGSDSLAGNPFTVRGRIRNIGTVPFTLAGVSLELPRAGTLSWLSFVPAGDSLRPGGTLVPGDEIVRDWTVRAANLPRSRDAALRVVVRDSFGVRMPGCEASIHLPGALGVDCALTGPQMVQFVTSAGTYQPSPLPLDLMLFNRLDTAVSGITARLELAQAPHLRLSPGESVVKQPPPTAAHSTVGSRWLLEVIPHPAAPVDDTLVVWYSAPGWPAERSCMHIVRIVPPLQAVSCALTAPVVTVTPEGRYAPDTVTVTWTLTNGGETTVPATRARLAISGDTVWCLDPLEQTVSALAAKQSAVRAWRLAPPTSPFGRGITLAVTTRDSLQNEIAGCASTLELPRVWPVVECTLTGPDTVHYLSATDSYQPDPSDLYYNVTNRVDTTITLTAALDLASAPHLALAPGETGSRLLGTVAPRTTANAVFRVTVDPRPETPVTDMPNAITTAHYGETADDVGCSTLMVIEGREKIYSAECFTAGHDTSWADVGNEDIIPHPLQMRLGIVNTGNEPLAGVTAAIVLPAGYILTTPPDSIQSYPSIAPGDTGRREWLMEVNREHPVEGAGTVRWTWSNARTSGECTREAVLLQGSPRGIALSRWRLDFRAERGKALPAAESVAIWTGNNNPYQWASASADGWIDASPGILTGKGTITIQPNTTALPEGFYEGTVAIVTNEFARPTPIEVGYEVYTLASAPAPPAPATPTLTCSPNPVRAGGVLEVRYAGSGPVRLRLIDALGRDAIAAATAPQTERTERMTIALPADLAAGMYFLEVTSHDGRRVRGVAVLR